MSTAIIPRQPRSGAAGDALVCDYCDGPLPASKRRPRRFCQDACRVSWHAERRPRKGRPPTPTERKCTSCRELLPVDQFYSKSYKCKPCAIAFATEYKRTHRSQYAGYLRSWRKRNRESHEAYMHAYKLRQYGLTPEQYDDLLQAQSGLCAICHRLPSAKRRLAVDHDHATGKVRGLLCYRCNTALGAFADDARTLHRAAEYLRKADG